MDQNREKPFWKRAARAFVPAVLLLWPGEAPAREGGDFSSYEFELPGGVQELVIEDVDQDGLKDLFITHVKGPYPDHTRGITVLFQDEGGFSPDSMETFYVDESVVLVDVGQVDGETGLEVLAVCRGGAGYYPLDGRGFGPLTLFVLARPFTAFADTDSLPYYDLLRDWNGDGLDELLLLEFDRSLVFGRDGPGLSREGKEILLGSHISINRGGPERLFQEHHSLRAFYFMPQLNAEDFDGDGLVDLVATYRSELSIFKQGPDRNFSREPAWTLRLDLPKPEPGKGRRKPRDNPPMVLIDDVNLDGRMDVIASHVMGGFGDLKSQTFIYYGHSGALEKNRWDQMIERQGAGSFALLRDLDGDGKKDLIIPYVKLDILNIARMIITSSINVKFAMHVLGDGLEYPEEPTGTNSTAIKVSFKDLIVESGVPNVDGDFDNDGINDVVVGRNADEIQVLRGKGGGNFEDDPWMVAPVVAPLFPLVDDLDNDGLADIVVSYIPDTVNDRKVYVFLNNKPQEQASAEPAR